MKLFNKTSRIGLYASCLLLLACQQTAKEKDHIAALPFYNDATFTPYWLPVDDESLSSFHKIEPFKLINQEGDTITEKIFEGKIYVTDFFFTTCPGICPKMMANMATLQEAFMKDEEVLLLSHSVTPGRDSVPVLKKYAEKNGISTQKWHLVTGTLEDIYYLGRKQYFVEEDLGIQKEEDEFLHTENFVLVDKNRHIRGIYNGLNKTAVNQLVQDIQTLQKEQ